MADYADRIAEAQANAQELETQLLDPALARVTVEEVTAALDDLLART